MYCTANDLDNALGDKDKIGKLVADNKRVSSGLGKWIEGDNFQLKILFKKYLEFRDP